MKIHNKLELNQIGFENKEKGKKNEKKKIKRLPGLTDPFRPTKGSVPRGPSLTREGADTRGPLVSLYSRACNLHLSLRGGTTPSAGTQRASLSRCVAGPALSAAYPPSRSFRSPLRDVRREERRR
jgi:hypothetical protein